MSLGLLLAHAAAAAAGGAPQLATQPQGAEVHSLESPHSLKVNGLLEAVAVISSPVARFSFVHSELATPAFGVTQSSYHITVSAVDSGALLWDSGDVASANCSEIVYGGPALTPFTRYTWTAAWTPSVGGGRSDAAEARFETGPMQTHDWRGAAWLQNSSKSQYRRSFALPPASGITWARMYVAASGCAHVEVNGATPLPDLMGICPWSTAPNTALFPNASLNVRYVTHDLTGLLHAGAENAVGVVAGSVMSQPHAMVLIMVQQTGGQSLFIHSGEPGWLETTSCLHRPT